MLEKQLAPLPYSQENEMMTLGCMLTSGEALRVAATALESNDFHFEEHQVIFRVLKAFYKEKRPVDTHLVSEELKTIQQLEKVGGAAYIVSLAQYAGVSSYFEEYIKSLKDSSLLRKLSTLSKRIEIASSNSNNDPEGVLEEALKELESLKKAHSEKLKTTSIQDKWDDLEEMLRKHRGQKYIGLCQKSIPVLDESLLGLRKLILLAAQPNVGKTALTIQLALDIVQNNPNACMVYFSLEMTARDILIRMCCHLSQMDYETFVLGSGNQNRLADPDAYFTKEELSKIEKTKKALLAFGDRIQIVDSNMTSSIDSLSAINYINSIKDKTGCNRVVVVIDYLQVWPMNPNLRFSSENEIDKWKVGEIKKIRDAINDDPILVISEARKPSGKEGSWGDDMADVMGSARGTYTPDVVMLMTQISDRVLIDWAKNSSVKGNSTEEQAEWIRNGLAKQGKSLCKLKAPKVRDGMKRFNAILEYNFHKNIFRLIQTEDAANLISSSLKTLQAPQTEEAHVEKPKTSHGNGFKSLGVIGGKK
ncbi:MAG: AAA family ATPase [Chlamydiae bacterium]|nr:AAA family ATPase [Chlamydiota bacterium]